MAENQAPQSIQISGQLSNAQLGGIAGRDQTVTQTQQINEGIPAQALTSGDIANLLDQLKVLLEDAELSTAEKQKAVRSIETAKDEVQADEPDQEFAAKSLQRATKALKEASETVDAGTSLWQKAKPILETVGPWLGVATSFLI